MIQEQVRLPVRVAFEVVIQGIRIRFGRSLVTIMGVTLGIAFLMSILTGQALKKGVSHEDQLRTEVKRMVSFLSAEMGPAAERTVGVIACGALSEVEVRMLKLLETQGLAKLTWVGFNGGVVPVEEFGRLHVDGVPLQKVGGSASAVLVLGAGEVPDISWADVLRDARQRVVAHTRNRDPKLGDVKATVVNLERELRPDEAAKLERAATRERYRGLWIVIISLLVTVIGISNAMLMSVTERFREIGTMKCLGALSAFVRLMFLIESGFMGVVGGVAGCAIGVVFSIVAYGFTYGFGLAFLSLGTQLVPLLTFMLLATSAGVLLSVVAAIYPASVASRMVPADALRSNV
jgi:ABC-type antimicrobial peptide transport system permease subunit